MTTDVWVKICGMNSAEAVEAAVAAGVQALGFVFAPGSPRQVTPARARQLCARLPAGILRVAVFQHPTQVQWQEVWEGFRPDVLQTDAQDFATLNVNPACQRLPVYRDAVLSARGRLMQAEFSTTNFMDAAGGLPSWLLFEGAISGQGRLPDWQLASRLARDTRLVLAGGLNPENVTDAIRTVRPFGVDVSSGVESSRGVKSVERIAAFVAAARGAEREGQGRSTVASTARSE